jgi:hypothetical protein
MDKLAKGGVGQEPSGSGPWMYEFNAETHEVTFLPNIEGTIVGSSADGRTLLFLHYSVAERSGALSIWSGGESREIAELPAPEPSDETFSDLVVAPVRATPAGDVFVFTTNSEIPTASNFEGSPANNGGGYEQVYRYDTSEGSLVCLSCAPSGVTPSGSAHTTTNDETNGSEYSTSLGGVVANQGISADGDRVFFDTPAALVPQEVNGERDVYEWEAAGAGGCPATTADGCRYLLSSRASNRPSYFLDNSENGNDVFIATAQGLVAGDTDGAYDVYDVRVAEDAASLAELMPCSAECQVEAVGVPAAAILSSGSRVSGNLTPPAGSTKSIVRPKPKKLTTAQKRAMALKACEKKAKRQQAVCKRQARKKQGKRTRAKKIDGRVK